VYIYYILLLAELGIIGLVSFLVLLGYSVFWLLKNNAPLTLILGASLVAFFVQYFFFGSYINVVYICLYIGIALGVLGNKKLLNSDIIQKAKGK
jgi:hypothetical protein